MADDDVQLPDLQVLARYSLAVRAATAPREEVVAALEADLAWLTGDRPEGRRPRSTRAAASPSAPRPGRAEGTAAPARRRRAPRRDPASE